MKSAKVIAQTLAGDRRPRKTATGWLTWCPAHDDHDPSLSLTDSSDGKVLFHCFAGCSPQSVITAMKAHGVQFNGNVFSDKNHSRDGASGGLTLEEFAQAKKLPVDFLVQHGVKEVKGKGGPYLVFEYRGKDGQPVPEATRFRFSMAERPKSKRGGKPALYGLWRLSEFRKGGEVIFDEGESDTLTAWSYGLPGLGLPGKTQIKTIDPADFTGFGTVFVWQEPDAPELPGQVAARLPGVTVKALVPSPGIKDISEAHLRGVDVLALVERLKEEARVASPEHRPGVEAAASHVESWELAARWFPRTPFPWDVFPHAISESFRQLARSTATSPQPLPGDAFCMLGSILGRSITVSPKASWEAPLIFWHGDIRDSGEGKTAPPRLLARPIHEAQKKEAERYKREMEAYKNLSTEERNQEPPPPPRGYFVSDLTLEGLREDLENSPHGGIVVIQDEISAFLTGQNQYKSRGGTDREGWLTLWDGHPARVKRVGRELFLTGARVSIFGGIQPQVFRTFFAGNNGLYLTDGTLFRFLLTYEPPGYYELTAESWEDHHRENWEIILKRAMAWVEERIADQGGNLETPLRLILDAEAQSRFFAWRNSLHSLKGTLPAPLRGFLPKAYEYALRLTGVIHCLHQFFKGEKPKTVLNVEDLNRGIRVVTFYLGQVQAALRLIENENFVPVEVSERSQLLARTLDTLRSHLDSGRLAISFIHDRYNQIAPETQRVRTAKAMGAMLRDMGLTIAPGKHDANGKRAAHCLAWNEKTENFIKECLQCLQRQGNQDWPGFAEADNENLSSAMSAGPNDGEDHADSSAGIADSENCPGRVLGDRRNSSDFLEVEI